MSILTSIVHAKRHRLAALMQERPLPELRNRALALRNTAPSHRLRERLKDTSRINIIAEFKRSSPSQGVIRSGVSAARFARWYEAGGAVAISVLTEEQFFNGSMDDLRVIRETVPLPVLRKDFVIDPYQVFESAAAGADAVLLIVAALDDDDLQSLRVLAEEKLGLDALVEVHTDEEMSRAIASGAKLIGINNRDLKTFGVSLETSETLAKLAPKDSLLVAESGLQTHADLKRLSDAGFNGFLIGETLMRAEAPDSALRLLLSGDQPE